MAGLKTLAKELQSKGRNGDTILAHINPQEAGILKALGGSGTRNPDTGLPEYFIKRAAQAIAKPFQQVASGATQAVKAVQNIPGIKQVSDVATQAFRPIDQALVGLDKAVGRAIPGGWGTVGTVAASMIPGGQFAALGLGKTSALTGLGALTGSGVLRPGKSFNLQGALIGGAAAYGSSKLADYLAAAGGAPTDTGALAQQGGSYTLPGSPELLNTAEPLVQLSGPTSNPQLLQLENLTNPGYMDVVRPPPPTPSIGSQIMSGNFGDVANRVGSSIYDTGASAVKGVGDFGKAVISPDTYTGAFDKTVDFGKSYAQNVSDVGSGIKNLITGAPGASQAATATGINPMQAAGALVYGGTGLMALDEQEKFLEESKRANAISQAEYDSALAEINRQRDYAQSVVNQSPFNPNPNRDVSIGETFYGRSGEGENLYDRMQNNLYTNQPSGASYAMGGQIDDELGGDYSAMGMDQGNLQKGLFGMGYAFGGMPNLALSRLSQPAFNEGAVGGMQQFAEGGTPRFLSGGGDGMSDSIPATINDKQPARLADGEFVIPADVVSHLGNGSSKAGAKQLYSMMDKIRKARTGNSKQGKQINPRKYLPA
jgi:hypothetical protein